MKTTALWLVLSCLFALASAATAAPLDLSSPDDAVIALRKMQCDLEDGKTAYFSWDGAVFSRVPGERDRKLFDYLAMSVRACKTIDDPEHGTGYRMVAKEVVVYLDPKSGEIVRTWHNPWTDEDVEVDQIANDPVNFTTQAQGRRGPFRFDATFVEGRGRLSIEVPLFYPNPMGGDYQEFVGGTYQAIEMFNFFFDEKALLDPEVHALADVDVAWARMAQWLPWMKMGSRVGTVVYNGAGKRVGSWDALPALLRDEIARNHPGFDTPPPLDDARPNETSWTAFKKTVDARRAAAHPQ